MSWESFIELLNSPAGKKLDRAAKRFLLSKVLFSAAGFVGIGEISEIVAEILNSVSQSKIK